MNELKAKSKVAGLCNMFLPKRHYPNPLTNLEYARVRDHGALTDRAGVLQLLGARHREHGNADPLRNRRAS
jgi:hypothetical protein